MFTRVVFARVTLPPMVAAPAADSVFTNDGGTICFAGSVDVVDVVLVVVLVVVVTTPTAVALAIVVVVVEAIELSTNVNSVVTT